MEKSNKLIYLIGSLRNPKIPIIANRLRIEGFQVFDDWFAGGKIADDEWKTYEELRGRSYIEALNGEAANHVYWFDKKHLDACNIAVLVTPAGKSAHLELGYMLGQGKKGLILLDTSDIRWDVMLKFATGVFMDIDGLIKGINEVYLWEK